MSIGGISGGGGGGYTPQNIKDEALSALRSIGANSSGQKDIQHYGSYILNNSATTPGQAQALLNFLKDNNTDDQKASNIAALAGEVAKTSGIPISDVIPTHLENPIPIPIPDVIPTHLDNPIPIPTPTKIVTRPKPLHPGKIIGPGGIQRQLGPGGTPPELGPGGTPPNLGPGGTPPNLGPGGTPPKRKN